MTQSREDAEREVGRGAGADVPALRGGDGGDGVRHERACEET